MKFRSTFKQFRRGCEAPFEALKLLKYIQLKHLKHLPISPMQKNHDEISHKKIYGLYRKGASGASKPRKTAWLCAENVEAPCFQLLRTASRCFETAQPCGFPRTEGFACNITANFLPLAYMEGMMKQIFEIRRGEGWEMRLGRWQDDPDMAEVEVDQIISDPPFTDYVSRNQRRSSYVDENGALLPSSMSPELSFGGIHPSELIPAVEQCRRWAVFFCAIEQIGDYADIPGYMRGMVWVKTNPTPQFSGDRPAMWGEAIAAIHQRSKPRWNGGGKAGKYVSSYHLGPRDHETQKPIKLMREIVHDFTDPGETVWDPYAGSGTTGVACLELGRRFIGHEVQERYFDAACERLAAAERGQSVEAYRAGQCTLFADGGANDHDP